MDVGQGVHAGSRVMSTAYSNPSKLDENSLPAPPKMGRFALFVR